MGGVYAVDPVDLYGVGATLRQKRFGCTGPVVIDARAKAHHAPPLLERSDREPARRRSCRRWSAPRAVLIRTVLSYPTHRLCLMARGWAGWARQSDGGAIDHAGTPGR
ncbi:MAG: hypothetical protein U0736_03635 [Gemmataceae bacterium]